MRELVRAFVTHPHDDAVWLTVAGEVDITSAPTLRRYLDTALRGSPGGLFVEVSGVRFLGMDGVDALDRAAERAERRGIEFQVLGASRLLERVLWLAGREHWLPPYRGANDPERETTPATPEDGLDLRYYWYRGSIVTQAAGLLDARSVPALRNWLGKSVAEGPHAVVVDISRLRLARKYLVSVFSDLWRRAHAEGDAPLRLVTAHPETRRMLWAASVTRAVPVLPTVAEAIATVGDPPARLRTSRGFPAGTGMAAAFLAEACRGWPIEMSESVVEEAARTARRLVAAMESDSGDGEVTVRVECTSARLTVAVTGYLPERTRSRQETGAEGDAPTGHLRASGRTRHPNGTTTSWATFTLTPPAE